MKAMVINMTIYIDIYFFLNTVMNMIVLYLSSKLLQRSISFLRLTSGAFSGGILSSLSLVLFPDETIRILASFIILFIMSAVSFGGKTPYIIAKNSFFTILTGAQISGVLEFFSFCFGYGGNPRSALIILSLTIPLLFLCVLIFVRHMRKKIDFISCDTVICLKNGEDILKFKGLYDSGNLLKDPYSGDPVILTSSRSFWGASADDHDVHTNLSDLEEYFRKKGIFPILIPVSRCGGKKELIIGFKPEYVLLKRGGVIKNDVFTRNITVGVLTDVSDFSGFECLLPAGII